MPEPAPPKAGTKSRQQQQQQVASASHHGKGKQHALTVGEPPVHQLQQLTVTDPVPLIAKSEPKQQQQQATRPTHQGQEKQRRDQLQETAWQKGKKSWPSTEERDRTHGPTFQHRSQGQSSMPIETPHDLPRVKSVQSVGSSTSSARGGAIPKASVSQKSSTQKPASKSTKGRQLRIPTKDPGTLGKSLGSIETNYMSLDISKLINNINVYKYDVEIVTKGPKKLFLAAFLKFRAEFLSKQQQGIAYDWKKIAVANFQLNDELTGDVQVKHPQTGKMWDFNVTIKLAKQGALVPIQDSLTK